MTITQVIKNEVHGRTKFEIERIKGLRAEEEKRYNLVYQK